MCVAGTVLSCHSISSPSTPYPDSAPAHVPSPEVLQAQQRMEKQVWQQQDQILELQRTKQEMQRKHGEEMEQMQKHEQLRLLDDFSRTGGFVVVCVCVVCV